MGAYGNNNNNNNSLLACTRPATHRPGDCNVQHGEYFNTKLKNSNHYQNKPVKADPARARRAGPVSRPNASCAVGRHALLPQPAERQAGTNSNIPEYSPERWTLAPVHFSTEGTSKKGKRSTPDRGNSANKQPAHSSEANRRR